MLPKRAKVIFTVQQLYPACRTITSFSVRGHKGVNRIRFASKLGRKRLRQGTYGITARTPNGLEMQRILLVVVSDRTPSQAKVDELLAASVCAPEEEIGSPTAGSTGASNTAIGSGLPSVPGGAAGGSATEKPFAGGSALTPTPAGVIPTPTVERTARALRPALIALLMAAIVLLGLASLPRLVPADGRINDVLARHRVEIVGVGAVALVAVVVSFLID